MIFWVILLLGSSNLSFHRERWETGMSVYLEEIPDGSPTIFWFAGTEQENAYFSNWTQSALPYGHWAIQTDGGRSENTADNLGYFIQQMGHHLNTKTKIIFISHDWHLPRIRRLWRKFFGADSSVMYRGTNSMGDLSSETIQAKFMEMRHIWNISNDVERTQRKLGL